MGNIFKRSALTRRTGFTPLEKTTRKRSSLTGFTLLELMLAMAILIVAILGLLAVLIHSILMNESNNNLVTAVNDAQYVLEQIKALAYVDIDDYSPPNFTISNENIAPNVTIQDIDTMRKNITVNITWTERQRSRSVQLSTRIASTTQ